MKRFRKILVGVDLATSDRLVCSEPYGPSAEAVRRGMWLAEFTQAHVTFHYSLDTAQATERLIAEHRGIQPNIFDEASEALHRLVERAEATKVEATAKVTLGTGWQQLIRQAVIGEYDLVIVGTRDAGPLQRVLVGSTAMKLLRKCPCPVWVTKPPAPNPSNAILVAHDLSPVGRNALELGASLSDQSGGRLHILHAMQLLEFDEAYPTHIRQGEVDQRKVDAKQELKTQAADLGLKTSPEISVVTGRPSDAILQAIDQHQIELLVMGTIARAGVRGMLMGNTAERLLPLLQCSVLAVKPKDFKCPIDVDKGE